MSDRGKPAGGWRWNIPQCTHHVLPVLFVLLQAAADRGAAPECLGVAAGAARAR